MDMVLKFCILASLFISQTSLGMIRVNRASLLASIPETSNPKLIYFSMTKNPTTGAINIIIDSDIKNKNNEVWDNLIKRNSWQQKVKDSIRSCACDVSIRIAHVKSVKDILDNHNFRIFPNDYVHVDFNQDFYVSNDDSEFAGEIFDSFHGIIWGNRKLTEARGDRKEKRAREANERREGNIKYRESLAKKILVDEAARKRQNSISFLIEENRYKEEREKREIEKKEKRIKKRLEIEEIENKDIEAIQNRIREAKYRSKKDGDDGALILNQHASEYRACNKCKRIGHRDFECTYIKCTNCHKLGHLAKDCSLTRCRFFNGKPGSCKLEDNCRFAHVKETPEQYSLRRDQETIDRIRECQWDRREKESKKEEKIREERETREREENKREWEREEREREGMKRAWERQEREDREEREKREREERARKKREREMRNETYSSNNDYGSRSLDRSGSTPMWGRITGRQGYWYESSVDSSSGIHYFRDSKGRVGSMIPD